MRAIVVTLADCAGSSCHTTLRSAAHCKQCHQQHKCGRASAAGGHGQLLLLLWQGAVTHLDGNPSDKSASLLDVSNIITRLVTRLSQENWKPHRDQSGLGFGLLYNLDACLEETALPFLLIRRSQAVWIFICDSWCCLTTVNNSCQVNAQRRTQQALQTAQLEVFGHEYASEAAR